MMKVAVLDDSAADVRAVLGMLDELASRIAVPFSAEAFTDPFALLDAVQEKGGFDLYLLDIIMPVMSGMEVASRIRRRGETCEIVFLTTSREYGVEAFGVRAAGYLLKPVDRVRLEDVLRAACEMIKHRRCRAVLRGQIFSTPFGVFSFCERAGAEIHIMIGEDPRSAGAFRIVPAEVDRHEKAAKAVAKSVLRLSDLGKDIRGGWAEVPARQAFSGESAA